MDVALITLRGSSKPTVRTSTTTITTLGMIAFTYIH
jgi:hypothetical protein